MLGNNDLAIALFQYSIIPIFPWQARACRGGKTADIDTEGRTFGMTK